MFTFYTNVHVQALRETRPTSWQPCNKTFINIFVTKINILILLQADKCINDAREMSDDWINPETGSHHAATAWDHCLMVIWHTRSWPGLDQDQAIKLIAKNQAHNVLSIMSRAAACLGVPEIWKFVAVSAMEAAVTGWVSAKIGAYQVC